MGNIFAPEKPLKEVVRENQRLIKKSIRELEKEIRSLETNQKKLEADIKKHAKMNQMVSEFSVWKKDAIFSVSTNYDAFDMCTILCK